MIPGPRPLLTTSLAALALLAATAAARAQVLANNPYDINMPTYSGSWGYSADPYSGYLHGAADVIRSQGQFMIYTQQARIMSEQVKAAKLETRRKQLEQWLWERETLPSAQDERERLARFELQRSRNDPPITEIWSAKALNDLLTDAVKIQSPGVRSASTPLAADVLAKINVTTGRGGGNIGLIKEGKLEWPLLLRRKEFEADRQRLDELVAQLVQQAARRQLDAAALEEVMTRVTQLQRQLSGSARKLGDRANWQPGMYTDAKSFLNQFDDALKVLQQPNAWQYLTGQYVAKGKTVGDLVQYMKENGLHFAPAMAGSEGAYNALYQALRDYDVEGGMPLGGKK